MTALGGELADYSELDIAAFTEWRLRTDAIGVVVEVANATLQYICGVLVPGYIPEPLSAAELGFDGCDFPAFVPTADGATSAGPTTSG